MRIVDSHVHWRPRSVLDCICQRLDYPRAEVNPRTGGYSYWRKAGDRAISDVSEEWFDIEAMFAHMDSRGVDIDVVSSVGAFSVAFSHFPAAEGRDLAMQWNEETAVQQRKYNNRFWGTGAVPLVDTALAIEVMEHAICACRLVGISLPGNIAGDPRIDAERLEPFYARAEELGTTLVMHPTDGLFDHLYDDYNGALYRTIISIAEISIAASRLVLSGIMERHPNLKVFLSHAGGALPYQSGRMNKNSMAAKLPLPASAYLKRMYTDTVSPQSAGIKFAVDYYGVDRVLFGSDYPCWNSEESLKFFAEATLSAVEQEKVYSANARRLFGLPAPSAAQPGAPSRSVAA